MKDILLNLLQVSGAFAACRWAYRRQALILTYHRLSEREDGVRISARAFSEQLEYLSAHYTLVPLSQMTMRLTGSQPIPSRMAAITIDDGYQDAYDIAFPLLRKYRAPATVFVVSDFVEGRIWLWTDKARYLTERATVGQQTVTIANHSVEIDLSRTTTRVAAARKINAALKTLPEEARDAALARLAGELNVPLPEQPPAEFGSIRWEQAREMAANGVEIGSHTATHPILPRLSDERLRQEMRQSKDHIETELRRKVETFCYPNGDSDSRVRREIERAGYGCAVTTDAGWNDEQSDPLALRRIHGEYDLAHFAQSTSGFELAKTRWRRWRRPVGEVAGDTASKELAAS
jgi:peptidoglycan/xylan/chitin deacetylase (PgdA/CDA1 family)